MRQQKQPRKCPVCGGPMKKTIGAQTRAKYWECVEKGEACFKRGINFFKMESQTSE